MLPGQQLLPVVADVPHCTHERATKIVIGGRTAALQCAACLVVIKHACPTCGQCFQDVEGHAQAAHPVAFTARAA